MVHLIFLVWFKVKDKYKTDIWLPGSPRAFVKRADIMYSSWMSLSLYLSWLRGLSWPSLHWCCAADTRHSLQLPYASAWSAGTSYSGAQHVTLYPNSNFKILREIWLDVSRTYLLVLLSSRSQRSSATRKTDFSLIGSEMEWTRPSNTSSTSSWLLRTWAQMSDLYHHKSKTPVNNVVDNVNQSSLPILLIEEKPVFVGKVVTHFMTSL